MEGDITLTVNGAPMSPLAAIEPILGAAFPTRRRVYPVEVEGGAVYLAVDTGAWSLLGYRIDEAMRSPEAQTFTITGAAPWGVKVYLKEGKDGRA